MIYIFPAGGFFCIVLGARERNRKCLKKEPEWSSRCPSFLAGERIKDGQKHGNIKQHTPTNRPNKKKDLGSLLKKWEHADLIPLPPPSDPELPILDLVWVEMDFWNHGGCRTGRLQWNSRPDWTILITFWLFRVERHNKPNVSSVGAQRIHRCEQSHHHMVENLKGSSWKSGPQ